MTADPSIAPAVLMVRPNTFGYNPQTAATNAFQTDLVLGPGQVTAEAVAEFDAMVQLLRAHDITVVVHDDISGLPLPDAVFPNNWFATRRDGQVFTYPMATENRRGERDTGALEELMHRYAVRTVTDLSPAETRGTFLEGTGVIVMDHAHRIAYGALSPRCDERLFTTHVTEDWGYRPVAFTTADAHGVPIYHTNVLMGIQAKTAVICADAIPDAAARAMVLGSLERTGHELILITLDQMAHFCGNVMQVRNSKGRNHLILSQTAHDAFTPAQRALLSRDNVLVPAAIPVIERVGGGSARCMVAEIFLQHAE